ncbi:MAG: type II toxin-antitoxin system prevent-host-death family antitoxin [Bryobacteraceae bacterium]
MWKMKVSVVEAKNRLTQLIQQVEKGERVTICRHGTPVVDLVPTEARERKPRRFGTLRDKIKILDPSWAKPQNDLEGWLRGDV